MIEFCGFCTDLCACEISYGSNSTHCQFQLKTMASNTSTPPTKASRFDESTIVRKLSPVKPASSLEDMDTPTNKRHDISHISENFMSWTAHVQREGFPTQLLPSFRAVEAATKNAHICAIEYSRDGRQWRSDIGVCLYVDSRGVTQKNFVVHLPNDGFSNVDESLLPNDDFFYVDESLLPVLATNNSNPKHMNTCSEGWAYLHQDLWQKLTPFEKFARQWFGYDGTKKLQRQIMYNGVRNRMDISLRCPQTKVGVDFVFEPGYPVPEVPEDFWQAA